MSAQVKISDMTLSNKTESDHFTFFFLLNLLHWQHWLFLTLTALSMLTPGRTVYWWGNPLDLRPDSLGQMARSLLEGSPEHLFWKHCKPVQSKWGSKAETEEESSRVRWCWGWLPCLELLLNPAPEEHVLDERNTYGRILFI